MRSSRSRTTSCIFQSYYKMPAPQTQQENCVAHNGSLIPIPGRDVMVQAWYQGGVSVFDWTDAKHPQEIAFFDRGPVDSTRMVTWRLLVGILVQRSHRQLGDRPWSRHLRAHAERIIYAERVRRGKDRSLREFEHAGAAGIVLARELRTRPRLHRSTRALQWAVVRSVVGRPSVPYQR